jgi:uncharacterized protein (TIGR02001 family)
LTARVRLATVATVLSTASSRAPLKPLGTATLLLALSLRAQAGEFGGFLAASSDNVYHGLSLTMGEPALSLDAHYRLSGGSFAGLTLATVNLNPGPSAPLEVGLYAGHAFALGPDWSARVMLDHYEYPGEPHSARYDYTEAVASLDWRDRLSLSLSFSPDTSRYTSVGYNAFRPATAAELALRWPLSQRLALTAGAGYRSFARPIGTGYAYGSVGGTFCWREFEADVAWIETEGRADRLFGYTIAGKRLVLTMLWRFGADAPSP